MLEAKKKDVFLAPAVGIVYTVAYEASDWGITTEIAESMNMLSKMESTCKVYHEIRKRGIRALPGGDYGFAWNFSSITYDRGPQARRDTRCYAI